MTLAHTWVGDEHAPFLGFVLHGVLGAGHNLRSFMRRIVEVRPDYRFALLDLRLHGKSLDFPPPHTLQSCVDDLLVVESQVGAPDIVIGHSLGGKVALCYAERVASTWVRERSRKPSQVWALDSDPGSQVASSNHQVKQVLQAAHSVPMPAPSREAVVERLVQEGLSSGISNWLSTNLERTEAGYLWRLDFDAIAELLGDYFSRDLWPFIESVARGKLDAPAIHLVVAERSDRWSGDMKERARELPASPQFRLHDLAEAGHWVHVDNPDGLAQILLRHLR